MLDLGLQPLANDFRKEREERAGFAPLRLMHCPKCSLLQLDVVVRPDILYNHYSYVTSKSATMRRHFEGLWGALINDAPITSLVEIGSNDGDFMGFAMSNGAAACGIDPAENLVEISRRNHPDATSICGLFDKDTASVAKQAIPIPDVILARHVFCHIEDWESALSALDALAERDTRIVIEAPYALNMLARCEFDTVYHEHLSYLTLRGLRAAVEDTPFRIHRIHHFTIHGGTVAATLRRRDSAKWSEAYTLEEIDAEKVSRSDLAAFDDGARLAISALRSKVQELVGLGKTVCGLGASAKSTVWMNACGFTRKEIAFITDNTPQKQWCSSPGSAVPIVDEGALLRERPDYAVLFAWNYAKEIIEKNSRYTELGGKFIIPGVFPEVLP